uniref:Ulp1 protease family, C-terminal catalytic domain containing protein n=1 Tax=Solanum tuberosum TaxID=4113 RepID=M1DVX4_SOLTU
MDPDTNRKIYDSDDEGWAENRKKNLHDPLNVRKEPNKNVPESSKPKVAKKNPKKKGRRAAPVSFRPTLLRNACSNIVPTTEELAAFDLPEVEHAPPFSPPLSAINFKHIDVVFYYLRKKSKFCSMDQYRYTTAHCLFISHVKNCYDRYYMANDDDLISTQEHIDRSSARSVYERDCGLYVGTVAEYLSDQIEISFVDFRHEYLRKRYAALLWNYGSEKAKCAYASENDNPPKPKGVVTPPPEEDLVHIK